MSLQEVQQFFQRYEAAFNALDGDAVADLWASPSGIADQHNGQGGLTWWDQDAPMRANHQALCEVYASAGFATTQGHIVAHQDLGAHHSTALLHWVIRRQDGSTLQAFHTHYHLMRGPQGPKVLLCTAFQENLSEMRS